MAGTGQGLTRREILKRGGAVGGAMLWMTPTIQMVGVSRHLAQTTSPVCDLIYAVKIEQELVNDVPTGGFICEDIWNQTATPPAKCLTPQSAAPTVQSGGCARIVAATVNDGAPWTVTLSTDCEYEGGAVAIKTSGDCHSAVVSYDSSTHTLTFQRPVVDGQVKDISHVEFIFCCQTEPTVT